MSQATVIHLRQAAPGDVYIGRGRGKRGQFGNPFSAGTREQNISDYRSWFLERIRTDADFRSAVDGLRGKRLICYCKPKACHGDVIVEYLNATCASKSKPQ